MPRNALPAKEPILDSPGDADGGLAAFVPLVFELGQAFQLDWSENWAVIGGERVKLQVAHTKLSHSRAFHLRAYPMQTHEMLFDAHNHALRVLGGVPRRAMPPMAAKERVCPSNSISWPRRDVYR